MKVFMLIFYVSNTPGLELYLILGTLICYKFDCTDLVHVSEVFFCS